MFTKRKSELEFGISAGKNVYNAELKSNGVKKIILQWIEGRESIYIKFADIFGYKEMWGVFGIDEFIVMAEELKKLKEENKGK